MSTVQQVLDLKAYRALRYYYYHCSNISFLPDILDEIGIPEKYRIAKPGTDVEMDERLQKQKDKRLKRMIGSLNSEDPDGASDVIKTLAIKKKIKKKEALKKYKKFVDADRRAFSKGALQRINHGHDRSPY